MNDEPNARVEDRGSAGGATSESVAAAHAAVDRATTAEAAPKRRGRHKLDCLCPICRARRGERTRRDPQVETSPVVAVDSAPVDTEAVRRCVSAVVTSGDRWLRQNVKRRALKLADETTATELSNAVGMEIEDADLLADLSAQVAAKHDVLGRNAPEILLATALVAHGVRIQNVLAKLTQLELEKKSPTAPVTETK